MHSKLSFAALAFVAGLAVAPVLAQQPGSPPGVGGWTPPPPGAGPQMQAPPQGMGGPMMGMGPGMGGRQMQMGMGPGMGGHQMQMGMGQGPRGRWANVTPEQRQAMINMRIANIKAALKLTPDQEKLFAPVEATIRDSAVAMGERAKQREAQGRPADPIAALRMRAEGMTTRAAMMTRLADAAQPLYASLSDEQKAQLPRVLRGMHKGGGKAMRMMREGWEGNRMGPGDWGMNHHRRWWNQN